jgi:hypothetical protein
MVRLGPGVSAGEVFTTVGLRLAGEAHGWGVARTRKIAAGELADRLMIETGQPVMSGWIYDSDFAYLAGGSQDGGSFEALFGEPYATDGDRDEQEALERLASPAGQLESANALSAWSETNTPKPVTPELARRIIEETPVFAEEAIASLLAELGLPGIASILDDL